MMLWIRGSVMGVEVLTVLMSSSPQQQFLSLINSVMTIAFSLTNPVMTLASSLTNSVTAITSFTNKL